MSKKKKVIIISLSALVGVIALMILLTFTLFAVRHVEVDFKSSTINLTPTSEEIVEHSGIKNGGSVFFQNKNKYIDNLENKYPYIRVVNIETVFPSKLVLHIVERDEVYAVKYQELYYICDYDFKVLKITDNFESDETNAIMLEGIQVEEANYALCDKLKVDNFANIYEKLYENNRVLSEQRSIIKDIEFFMENDGVYQKETLTAKLTLFNGQVYRINNCERGLKGKTKLFIDVYSQFYNFIGKTITTKDGEEVVLTEENLLNSTIEINNYYNYTEHSENDCYFDIILN